MEQHNERGNSISKAAPQYTYGRVGIMWACHPEHNNQPGRFQLTLPLNFKSTRVVPQRYSSSSSSGTTNTSKPHILRSVYDGAYHTSRCIPPPQTIYRSGDQKLLSSKTTTRFITGVSCIAHPLRSHAQ